ncbi:uncharacterized protein cfap92 [Heterodontus francisci]|uniref:uncharacterized protein cfap92 n=1 Tax=Heterodontus francisci TaxID=7792 RepID=UPI00355C70B6
MDRLSMDGTQSVSTDDSASAEGADNNVRVELDSGPPTDDGDVDSRTVVSDTGERTPVPDQPQPSSPELSAVLPEIQVSSQDKNYTASPSRLVKFTMTVTLAVPNVNEGDRRNVRRMSKSMRIMETSSPLKFYHIEWSLLPNAEPTKLDLVVFASAAKIYIGNDSQVLKPWNDGEEMWLIFSHDVELPITKELLLTLGPHLMTLQVWEGKDKVCAKAKFDRPKGLRFLMEKENTDGIKLLVQEQLKLLGNSPLLTTYNEVDVMYPEQLISFLGQGVVTSPDPHNLGISDSIIDEQKLQSEKKLCADLNQSKLLKTLKKKGMSLRKPAKRGSHKRLKEATTTKESKNKTESAKPQQRSQKKKGTVKHASGVINLDIRLLLAGDKSVTNKMDGSIPGILDALFTVSVDKSLMSEELERELNPMVIRIISASSLPSTPVPIHVLEERCGPVYCQYQFYDLPHHQTKGRGHGTEISFKDVNVILTGTFNPDKLKEYLLGPALEIEVHDRDRKLKPHSQPPALFGTEPEDTKLSNVGLVSSKRTVHDPFTNTNKSWDPYGIAKVTFADLVYGEKCLNIAVSIQNSSSPDPMGYRTDGLDERILGISGAVDGPEDSPLPKGHYLESNSVLNVRVELAYPLTGSTDVPGEIGECQFGRIIYIFDYKNTNFLHDLLEIISSINSVALCLDSQTNNENEAADRALKTDVEQKESSYLDILTGFHVMDGIIHLFVLEGLRNSGIKKLWEKLPIRSLAPEEEKIKVLYNSDFSFHQRLYANLDDRFYHIYLHEPLYNIAKQPLLYIRDMTPQDCFQALCRLQHMCSAKRLRDVVQCDLFPTAAMVMILSREFGIPASEKGPFTIKKVSAITNLPVPKVKLPKRMHYSLLDIYNENYMQREKDQIILTDHIQANIDAVYQASKKLKKTKRGTIAAVPPEGKAVHIYSTQTLNSAEQAKELLRQEMAKKPNHYFTYNQEFLSARVTPVDVNNEEKRAKERSKEAWLTFDGFRYPGFKSSLESNEHPKKPDPARISDLKKIWKENILHGNLYVPILQRGRWKWSERNKDFELYKKVSYASPQLSIHLAGDTLRAEQLETIYKGYEDWRSKVIADNTKIKCCRRAIDSELQTTGPETSTQLDKPTTAPLKQPITFQKQTTYSDVGDSVRCKTPNQREITKGFAPGLSNKHSWKVNSNIIPRYDMEHKKFADLRGNDFNVYCNKHSRIYNRKLHPLNEEMEKTHLLQKNNPPMEVL